jgi:hypothetical protein
MLDLADRAQAELAVAPTVAAPTEALVRRLIAALPVEHPDTAFAGIDKYQSDRLLSAAVLCLRALGEPDAPEARHDLRVGLERLRQTLRDLLEDEPIAVDRPARDVARWLEVALDRSQSELAALAGVGVRTWQRWVAEDGTAPSGDDAARLLTLARVANHLRHGLTGAGVVRWFDRAHPELGGAAPATLLDDPLAYPDLVRLASGARTAVAT